MSFKKDNSGQNDRQKSKWQQFWAEPGFAVAAIIVAALLILFILVPVVAVFLKSFGIGSGGFTLTYYEKFFSTKSYFLALKNSVAAGFISTIIILLFSIPFALYVSRTKSMISKAYRGIALLPLVAPPFIFSLALIILFGRRGVVSNIVNDLFGWEFSIYGFGGVVTAQVLGFFPIAYMMIESSLRSINANVEEASHDLGAGQSRTLRKITLPLASKAILKAGLLVFVMVLADFSNPLVIGGGVPFLASEAFALVTGRQNLEMAAVLGIFLIVPSLLVFLFQTYFIKDNDTTAISSTSGGGNLPLKKTIRALMFGVSTMMVIFISIMFLMVFAGAFTKLIGVDNSFTFIHFTNQSGWEYLYNSLLVSFFAAVLAAGLGILQGYLSARKNLPGKKFLEFIALFGLAVPGTVIGIGYILIFNGPPFFLTGTVLLLVLNMTFRKVGVGLEAGISKFSQIDISMEEASSDLGASRFYTFRKVVFPLVSPAFMVGFVYTFMTSMISVSSVIFLIAPGTNLASVYILNLASQSSIGRASSMSFILIMIVIVCMGLTKWIEKRSTSVL